MWPWVFSMATIPLCHSASGRRFNHRCSGAVDLDRDAAQAAMDEGRYLFVLDIPEHFEADVQAQRPTAIQLWVDATAMAQGQLGVAYLTEIVLRETLDESKKD